MNAVHTVYNDKYNQSHNRRKHRIVVNNLCRSIDGMVVSGRSNVTYNGSVYYVAAHGMANNTSAVIDYERLYECIEKGIGIIFVNPITDLGDKVYIISDVQALMTNVNNMLNSNEIRMSNMRHDIIVNDAQCILIDLNWLSGQEFTNIINIDKKEIMKFTDTERNEMVVKYEPLINKLTAQFYHKTVSDWQSIKSMAYEGFVLAMNKFDPERSKMSFMSFAAFEMRNNIMTCLTNESRTVKLPFEEQKKLKESGRSTFNSVSIDHKYNGDDGDDLKPRETVMGMAVAAKFDDGDIFDCLYTKLEDRFNTQICEIFYMTFGLKGYEETPNKEIAKHFGVSEGRISQRKKEVIEFIRNDGELCEMLANLL